MINPRKVSRGTRRRRRKKKRRIPNQHLDQQNVQHALNRADHRSDRLLHQVDQGMGKGQITRSMGNQELPHLDQELLSSLTELLVPGVLRLKLDQEETRLIIELHRLNHVMGGECRLLPGMSVRHEPSRLEEKEVQHISHSITDHQEVRHMGNAKRQQHLLNLVLLLQTQIHPNANHPLHPPTTLNHDPRRRNLLLPTSLRSLCRLRKVKLSLGSKLNPKLASPCRVLLKLSRPSYELQRQKIGMRIRNCL